MTKEKVLKKIGTVQKTLLCLLAGAWLGAVVIFIVAISSMGCINMPDITKAYELAEKVKQTVKCQGIASSCIEIVASIDRKDITADDILSVQLCADRWETNGCSTIVDELVRDADSFFPE